MTETIQSRRSTIQFGEAGAGPLAGMEHHHSLANSDILPTTLRPQASVTKINIEFNSKRKGSIYVPSLSMF